LKSKSVCGALVAAAHRPAELPRLRPVVALVGRSNVGKSSLLNRLLGVTAARTSRNPGRTRGIYFYETGEGHYLADLPGVGYARVSAQERESWKALAGALFEIGSVKLVLRLIDSRVPDSEADEVIRDFLFSRGLASIAVATKWDRLPAAQRVATRRRLEARHGEVLPVSAKSGEGIETLRRQIRQRIAKDGSHG
jgi:GTP-binding protein